MSVRFVIRKKDLGFHQWILRDGLCPRSETHDYVDGDWTGDCDGWCDTFRYFSSALNTAASAAEVEAPK